MSLPQTRESRRSCSSRSLTPFRSDVRPRLAPPHRGRWIPAFAGMTNRASPDDRVFGSLRVSNLNMMPVCFLLGALATKQPRGRGTRGASNADGHAAAPRLLRFARNDGIGGVSSLRVGRRPVRTRNDGGVDAAIIGRRLKCRLRRRPQLGASSAPSRSPRPYRRSFAYRP